MKKSFFTIAVCAAISLSLFVGCAKQAEQESSNAASPVTSSDVMVEESATPNPDTSTEVQNAEAEQAFMDFLSGVGSVVTSEKFGEDDEYKYNGLLYGSYTYSELRDAISEMEMSGVIPKYAFFDFGSDGVNEMLLQFERVNPSLMSWVGTVKYEGGKLCLNDYYEYGYRTFATLFSSGYLQIGGSSGAGAHSSSIKSFDENGVLSTVFSESELYGLYAGMIVYDLREDVEGLAEDYSTLLDRSEFIIREYSADGEVKLSVSNLSDDPSIRKGEEAFLNEMKALGAEPVSNEEMDELCSVEPYSAPEMEWTIWNDGTLPDPDVKAVLTASVISPDDSLIAQSDSYYIFSADDSEYQTLVLFLINTPVRNFRIYTISMTDVTPSGEGVFDAKELYCLYTLTSDKPLIAGITFWGDLPTTGISFEDGSGTEHFLSLGLSGKDGSLVMSPAVFNW